MEDKKSGNSRSFLTDLLRYQSLALAAIGALADAGQVIDSLHEKNCPCIRPCARFLAPCTLMITSNG